MPISAAVGQYVAPTATVGQKLQVIDTPSALSGPDRVVLLFCLMRDRDVTVRERAGAAFTSLSADLVSSCIAGSSLHPAILDAIARLHGHEPLVSSTLLNSSHLSPQARLFLESLTTASITDSEAAEASAADGLDSFAEDMQEELSNEEEPDTWDQEAVEEDPFAEYVPEACNEHFSKYQLAQTMGIAEKIKMALTGDKEWRAILVRDANKLVSGSVLKNPRITEAEVLGILKAGVQNDEIIRLICVNKEWIKNYQIRKALVENPKTPLPNALRYLATLGEKDVASYAKSKNISSVISTQAKRMLLAKKR